MGFEHKSHRFEHKSHRCAHHRSDGERSPLCAEVPPHRGITEGYPNAIQSLSDLSQEERSNSAQSGPLSVTQLGEWRALCASSL